MAWDEHDAGYIDNVAGTDLAGGIVDGVRTFPVGNIQVSNASTRKNDYNDTDIYGARAALKIDLDNNWSITPSLMGQKTDANGSYSYNPAVGDLQTVTFNPQFSHDTWYQAALTIEGKIGNLDTTFAGAFMDRKIKSQLDYSDYSYFYDSYLRLASSPTTAGTSSIRRRSFTAATTSPRKARNCASRRPARTGSGSSPACSTSASCTTSNRDTSSRILRTLSRCTGWPDTLWLTEQTRIDRDYAAFAEVSYDIRPDLTLTAGGRIFESDNSLVGFFGYSGAWDNLTGSSNGEVSCFAPAIVPNTPCTDLNKETDQDGFTHKLNLTWRINDDKMVYFTWSTGFRPGGVNRNFLDVDRLL